MKTDLIDLLGKTEIVHPTRIAAVEACHRELRITEEGLLDAATLLDMEEDEALEVFRVSRLAEEPGPEAGTA